MRFRDPWATTRTTGPGKAVFAIKMMVKQEICTVGGP